MDAISQSGIQLFKTCRMAFRYGYVMNLDPFVTNEAVERGTSFHALMAAAARGEDLDASSDMIVVADEYLRYKPLPENILAVEEPFWIDCNGMAVRCTYDLVYKRGSTIVVRDYKTFVKSPTLDLDLDFQARFYATTAMRHYKTLDVEFEYEYVRQSLYHEGKQAHVPWTPEERYLNFPIVISPHQAEQTWREAEYAIADILRTEKEDSWYRSDKKGWGGCTSCFYNDICKTEYQLGELDEQTLSLLANKREPITKDTK